MGSYYYLYDRKCPYCKKKMSETIFSENNYDENGQEQGFGTDRCEHCKKSFKISMGFTISKLED